MPIKRVALFRTCLIDLFRPSAATASAQLLKSCGYSVHTPSSQTCCGQPGYNAGDLSGARQIAKNTIHCLSAYDKVIVPSGSCAGMIKNHYPSLFEGEAAQEKEWHAANRLAAKTEELSMFLAKHMPENKRTSITELLCYHPSCSSLREMNATDQPARLLKQCCNVEPSRFSGENVCCGFGGMFSIKYSSISVRLADDKLNALLAAKASIVVSADMGCLLQLAGRAKRRKLALAFYHISEVLAGHKNIPPI